LVFEIFPVMPVGLLPEIGAIPLDGIFLGKAVVVKLVFNFQIAVDTVFDLIDGDVADWPKVSSIWQREARNEA